MRKLTVLLVLVLGLWVGSPSAAEKVRLQPFAEGLVHPMTMLNPPDEPWNPSPQTQSELPTHDQPRSTSDGPSIG